METLVTMAAAIGALLIWFMWGAVKKMRLLNARVGELSPEAAHQMSAFNHSYNKAYTLGREHEWRVYKALELVVYTTGSPVLFSFDATYPLLNQPGHVERMTDAELDELIEALDAMPEEDRKQLHAEAKTRRPPRRPFEGLQ